MSEPSVATDYYDLLGIHPDASSVASASIDLCAARGAACPD